MPSVANRRLLVEPDRLEAPLAIDVKNPGESLFTLTCIVIYLFSTECILVEKNRNPAGPTLAERVEIRRALVNAAYIVDESLDKNT